MTLYPTLRRRRRATLAADAVVLLLVALFAWLGLRVHDAVADLAGLGRGVEQAGVAVGGAARDAAGALRDGFGAAAGAVGGAPVIGGPVAGALREGGAAAARPVQSQGAARARALIAAGREEQAQVHRTANLLGWLAFLLPTFALVAGWGPSRLRQVRALGAARRALAEGARDPARERELARRAAYSLPYTALARHTPDPFGDLLAARHERLLAALAEDAGIALPGAR